MNPEERYRELALKWLNNTISSEEREEFARWYNEGQDHDIDIPESFASNEEELKNRIYLSIESRRRVNRVSLFRRSYTAVAAIVLVILSASLYFYRSGISSDQADIEFVHHNNIGSSIPSGPEVNDLPSSSSNTLIPENDIAPGKDKAILTLGDGSKIILDDAREGILANQGGNSILMTAAGELIYTFSGEESVTAPVPEAGIINYNTIETQKGGKFQVVLPDGSKVWLNAASSLRFPAAFNGRMRQVELKGEAYFEVAPDKSRVFEVITRDQRVEVLGTHFNINAYADEPSVNTTLLEGSVRISDSKTNASQLLKPGEQAKLSEKLEVVSMKNTAEAVAWKDGYFQFDEADIQTVMRQIERWYDVKVYYEDGFKPSQRFGGEIERSLSLVQVLKILEKSKVHFGIKGREVTVMK